MAMTPDAAPKSVPREAPEPPPPAPPVVSPEEEQALRDARYRYSRGAQVVFHPDSDASLGARGGAGSTIEENTLVRDAHLVALGIDPRDPDASHLPGNTVPPGGEVSDKVSYEHEPHYDPAA